MFGDIVLKEHAVLRKKALVMAMHLAVLQQVPLDAAIHKQTIMHNSFVITALLAPSTS